MNTNVDQVADQIAQGITADGEAYTVARYGTTVVVNIDGNSDDTEAATEAAAIAEFDEILAGLTEAV